MENLTRRGFVGTAATLGAVTALAAGATSAHASESASPVEEEWAGTPEELQALGESTMPLEELNRRRAAYVDSFGDYTREDGTVVPAVFVKVCALINTYGFGGYSPTVDTAFDDILLNFDEDLAQAFLDMPRDVHFSPVEFAEQSGRPVEECREACETLFDRGFLACATWRATPSTGRCRSSSASPSTACRS